MQILAPDRTGIPGEVRPARGETQQPASRAPRPAVAPHRLLQEFTHQRVDGGVVLGRIDFGLANDLSGETEGNVPCLHKKIVTHNHVLHEKACGTLALGWSPDLPAPARWRTPSRRVRTPLAERLWRMELRRGWKG